MTDPTRSSSPRPTPRRPRTAAQRRRARRRHGRRGRGRGAGAQQAARGRLRGFRQATILAVAITAFLLVLFGIDEEGEAAFIQDTPAAAAPAQRVVPDTVAVIEDVPTEELIAPEEEEAAVPIRADTLVRAAAEEAREVVRGMWHGFLSHLPRFLVALGALLIAWLLMKIVRPLLRRVTDRWERGEATMVLFAMVTWLFAIGVAVSVIAGDVRALLGSLGLVGLALSWALQTPIESFTGWLLNSFRGYYRVGDRVSVGEVFGDVYQIDPLNTMVWEIGSPGRGFVNAEQPTGRLITFPNSEVLAGSIVNLTRDFPWVWDEVTAPVGNRSDMDYAAQVLLDVARRVVGESMKAPAEEYGRILRAAGLEGSVPTEPQVFFSLDDSWTNVTVRYLIPARERRRWMTHMAKEIMTELKDPRHADRIIGVFPRRQIQLIGPDGKAREIPGAGSE